MGLASPAVRYPTLLGKGDAEEKREVEERRREETGGEERRLEEKRGEERRREQDGPFDVTHGCMLFVMTH